MELLKKLRINADKPLYVVNAQPEVYGMLPGIDIKEKLPRQKPVEQLMLFAVNGAELGHYLQIAGLYIGHDTLLWICYPKKTGAIQSDLILMKTWDIVFNSGYRGQTSVSINDDWTGMRFTNAPKKNPTRGDLAPADRKTEGIDYVKRTAVLPADAIAHLAQYKGMSDYFNSLAFTHKKEHIEAIADAKKPETRARRIEKMADMLMKKMGDGAKRVKG